ncbi:hypothetical protein [Dysosmobacter welbionis]|uniref:hypothetical protein n=1 Tax=Dysosmobacter welbionis TaxID=2093857 RepID=UPI00300F6197
MAKRTRRRRRSWSRLLLLVVFVAAALYAGYFCLFRPPEVPAETTRPDEAEEVSAEDTAQDAEALAQAAHLERKPYFYTILVSGVDDHNGGSDTNILVAVDAENDYIYGVSIPGTPRPSSMERTTRSTSPITPAGPLCWPRPSPSSWASQWILR